MKCLLGKKNEICIVKYVGVIFNTLRGKCLYMLGLTVECEKCCHCYVCCLSIWVFISNYVASCCSLLSKAESKSRCWLSSWVYPVALPQPRLFCISLITTLLLFIALEYLRQWLQPRLFSYTPYFAIRYFCLSRCALPHFHLYDHVRVLSTSLQLALLSHPPVLLFMFTTSRRSLDSCLHSSASYSLSQQCANSYSP